MYSVPVTTKSVSSLRWQDYRGAGTGLIQYYNSDPVSELPIREIPESLDTDVSPDPNYETGTYGMYGCVRPKVRQAFVKGKSRYLFFMTKYSGTNAEYTDKVLITGYYRLAKIADAKKFHLRYCKEYACIDLNSCPALLADEVHFVSLDDAFLVDEDALDFWGYKSKITKQTRIQLDEEQAGKLVTYLGSRPNAIDDYVEETERLQPHSDDEEMDDEE